MEEKSIAYRADIDGLRALAVCAVVAYHAFPLQFPGGFIGVDIFFVISGFLITGIVQKALQTGTFSLVEFYRRRIRRIFPALIVVLCITLALGWQLLLPDELQDLGRGAASGAGFFANVQMWRESGYFDLNSARRPLLHLWSLGVEEQFYFVWPVLLFLLHRFKRRTALTVFTVIAAASLIHSARESSIHPSYAFYLPFTRFWELTIGGILASMRRLAPTPAMRNISALLGLGLLSGGLFLISDAREFPGTWALLPVIGTALLIAAGPDAWFSRTILAKKPLVFIGLISYPLYLWHWPLLVYARTAISPSNLQTIGIVALAGILSFLTWHLIERPIRESVSSHHSSRTIFALASAMTTIFLISAGLRYSSGFSWRMPKSSSVAVADVTEGAAGLRYPEGPSELASLDVNHQSRPGRPDAVVYGDSHAAYLFHGLASVDKTHNWLGIASIDCSIFLAGGKQSKEKDCDGNARRALDYLSSKDSPDTVLLAHYGYSAENVIYGADRLGARAGLVQVEAVSSTDRIKQRSLEQGLKTAIGRMQAAGKRVVYLIDVPEMPVFARDCVQRTSLLPAKSLCSVTLEAVELRQRGIRSVAENLKKALPDLIVMDTVPALCNGTFPCELASSSFSFYEDSQHLSVRGASKVARELLPKIGFTHAAPNSVAWVQ